MCSPRNGENTPEDAEREVAELEEKNGMSERRKPRFQQTHGATKMIAVALALAGVVLVTLSRAGAGR